MKRPVAGLVAILGLLLTSHQAAGQVQTWQLGGEGGQVWSEFTQLNVLADDFTEPSALRPRELDPEVNLLPLLSSWQYFRYPRDPLYQDGQPRIWRGLKIDNSNRYAVEPSKFVDGDPNTAMVKQNWGKMHDEFYTIDVGAPIPFERFVYYPPEGFNTVTDEPFRPNYTVDRFELTATNDLERMEAEEPTRGPVPGGTPLYNDYCNEIFFNSSSGLCHYVPLDVMLHSTGQNFAGVVDLGGDFNFVRVTYGVTPLRREGEELVAAPDASVRAEVDMRTGRDESPIAYLRTTPGAARKRRRWRTM